MSLLRPRFFVALVGLLVLLASPRHAHARVPPAPDGPATAIAGTITTLDGKVRLPGVVVSVSTLAGVAAGEAVTDEKGQFRIEVPAAGRYRVKATIEGFHPGELTIEMTAGATQKADFDLRLFEIEQRVDVTPTDDTPMNLAKPLSPAERIDGKDMAGSSISAGSVAGELRWLPGVSPYGREWAIKGGRPNQIGLQVEAAQVVDPAAGTSPVQLPGDAVSSIQVLANPYSVEFGRFSSGVIVVTTRTGANKWSATVNNFIPGLVIDRNNPFKPIGFESIDPRVAVGGPILKQKLFLAQSTQYRYMSNEVGSRPQDERSVSRSLSSFTRLDYVLSDRHTLTGTFALSPENSDWVNLNTFTPPGATANLMQRVYRGGFSTMSQLPHALVLETLAHLTKYRSGVEGHGAATEMTTAPSGMSGTYFGKQDRESDAWQVSSIMSGFVNGFTGQHLLKAGIDVLHAGYTGLHEMLPINVLRQDGTLTRRLTQAPSRLTYEATDAAVFFQDRWHLANRLLLELGVRIERDGVFERTNLIPRVGAAFALNKSHNAAIRGGFGYFFERTPTLAGAFGQQSDLVETPFFADGRSPGVPVTYVHALGSNPKTPRSTTWNLGYEHRVKPWLSIRFNHLQREGSHELMLDSGQQGPNGWIQLESSGRSRYRDTEAGAHIKRGTMFEVDLSYTHSSSEADLNDAYGYYLNTIRDPFVRPNQYGPTDTDAPHRFVMRGRAMAGDNLSFEWAGELRSGRPWSAVNEQMEFVGTRNGSRYPRYGTLDVAVERRFRIGKFQPWIGVMFINALDRFNPVDVQRNIGSPDFGTFYSSSIRQIRFTVHFRP
ncbi:MAG TPA: TonB-dependent receptor [Vicinamibacterales bacterium]